MVELFCLQPTWLQLNLHSYKKKKKEKQAIKSPIQIRNESSHVLGRLIIALTIALT